MPYPEAPPTKPDIPSIPDYDPLFVVGNGAYGTVWLAKERLTGLVRAVKLLAKAGAPSGFDPARELDGVRRYQQIARDNAALVQIYHVGETDTYFYYVMEAADRVPHLACSEVGDRSKADTFDPKRGTDEECGTSFQPVNRAAGFQPVEPERVPHPVSLYPGIGVGDGPTHDGAYQPSTLAHRIETAAPLPAAEALTILRQLLEGLSHLHAHGLIHRDVKPSNVLFVGGRVKLADMGLVTTLDREITQIGTPDYMTPEGTVDQSSDLYAAGVILYKMITGYPRSRFPELPILNPAPRAERRALHAAIRIANKAANFDRRERYRAATEFAADLTSQPRRKTARYFVLSTAVLMLVAGIAAISIWQGKGSRNPVLLTEPEVLGDNTCKNLVVAQNAKGDRWTAELQACLTHPSLVDLNGDGFPEVVVGMADKDTPPTPPDSGKLFAFTARDGDDELTRIWPEGLNLFADRPWRTRSTAYTCGVGLGPHENVDGLPGDELFVSATFQGSPTRIVSVNHEGRFLGSFWHYGQIDPRQLIDLDGDDRPELICIGFGNHPVEADGNEPGTQAVMILNLDVDGGFHGQWRIGSTKTRAEVGSLQAYAFLPLARIVPQESEQKRESDSWHIEKGEARVTVVNGRVALEFRLAGGLIIIVDDLLRPTGEGIRPATQWVPKPGERIPPVDKVWQHLWPKD